MSYKDGFRWELFINGKKVKYENKCTAIAHPLEHIITNEIRRGCLNCYGKSGKTTWEVVCDMEDGNEASTQILNYIADEILKGEVEGGGVCDDIENGYDHAFKMFDFEKKIYLERMNQKEKTHHNTGEPFVQFTPLQWKNEEIVN